MYLIGQRLYLWRFMECLSGSCVNETCSHALRRLRLPENECDDECHCLGGHCCKEEYPHCTECNRMGGVHSVPKIQSGSLVNVYPSHVVKSTIIRV